uniref:RRM domain-containing protein n=1 Tax=Eptatretus burgeri TaxID=7764 RepID=A0A8C4QMW7_EPTBU
MVDEHQLELKISERASRTDSNLLHGRHIQKATKQKTSKILVRNIPFQTKKHEVQELFSAFGEIKMVRLPKKMSGSGMHRGFGFVDFLTRRDAKKAMEALCHSTHLYGRRLVLEWAKDEDGLDALRRKTAENYHDVLPKKQRSAILEDIVKTVDAEETDLRKNL